VVSPAPLDRDRLLAWLDERSASVGRVPTAVYLGLADRIRRGDFDAEPTDDRVFYVTDVAPPPSALQPSLPLN
jgi:hypothetical protein